MTNISHFLLLGVVGALLVAATHAADGPKKKFDSGLELSVASADAVGIIITEPNHMSMWKFLNRVIREVTPVEQQTFLDQFETLGRQIVLELDRTQNYQFNKTDATIEQLMPLTNSTNQMRGTGEIFQDWMIRTFDVAYDWAKNNESEIYRTLATDFKFARDWIQGLSKFDRFTEQHVQVVTDFYRAYSARPDWGGAKSASTMYNAFKEHVAMNAVQEAGANNSSSALLRIRRSAMMPPRTEGGFWGWFWTFMDYHEDAVVAYNRIQMTMWPTKMAVSFIAPPVKFIWTAVDFGYCLHEEIYELAFAQSTEERWWDVLLCGMELLGIFPGAGALKFALRIGIRMLKFQLGIHTVPWWLSGPWLTMSNWWYGTNATATTQLLTTLAMKSVATTQMYNFGSRTTTNSPFIIGSMSG